MESDTENNETPPPRDFVAEFASFLREHEINISVEELYHLNPLPEEESEIRQYNHAMLRSPRSRQTLVLCMTSYNWDAFPTDPVDVIRALGAEAYIVEVADGSFVNWAQSLDWNPDSRAAERKFRQTLEMVKMLRLLLSDAAYGGLLELYAESAVEDEDMEDDEEEWGENGDGVGRN